MCTHRVEFHLGVPSAIGIALHCMPSAIGIALQILHPGALCCRLRWKCTCASGRAHLLSSSTLALHSPVLLRCCVCAFRPLALLVMC